MGTVIGSIYPLDNIIFEQGSYRNNVNPSSIAAGGGQTSNPAAAAASSGFNTAVSSVLIKYGAMPPKPLNTMNRAELRSYKRVLEAAAKAAQSEADRNVINIQIAQVNSALKEFRKEKTESFFGTIWDGLVTASGVQPKPEGGQSGGSETNIDNTDNENKNKGNTKNILIGVGVGVGVLLIGTITYLAIKKK